MFSAYYDSAHFEDFKAIFILLSLSKLVFSAVCLLANFILNSNLVANVCMLQKENMFKHACKTEYFCLLNSY